jgi:predicted nuclease of predicted toxin-antitoxin system
MKILVDAQISPQTARWIEREFRVESSHVFTEGLLESSDAVIFEEARARRFDVILTKDHDFLEIVETRGTPPKILWLTCGNCSNDQVHEILRRMLPRAIEALMTRESIVEISGVRPSQ